MALSPESLGVHDTTLVNYDTNTLVGDDFVVVERDIREPMYPESLTDAETRDHPFTTLTNAMNSVVNNVNSYLQVSSVVETPLFEETLKEFDSPSSGELEVIKNYIGKLRTDIQNINESNQTLNGQNSTLQGTCEIQGKEIIKLMEQVKTKEEGLVQFQNKINELEEKLSKKLNDNENLTRIIREMEADKISSITAVSKSDCNILKLEDDIRSMKDQLDKKSEIEKQLVHQIASLTEELQSTRSSNDLLESQIQEQQLLRENIQKDISNLREENQILDNQYGSIRKEIKKDFESRLNNISHELQQKLQEIEIYRTELLDKDNTIASLNAIIQAQNEDLGY